VGLSFMATVECCFPINLLCSLLHPIVKLAGISNPPRIHPPTTSNPTSCADTVTPPAMRAIGAQAPDGGVAHVHCREGGPSTKA